MCDAISGGGKLPLPAQQYLAPTKGAPADAAGGGGASAATPAGPAAAGAALLGSGPGSLGAVLTALVDALRSLVASLGGGAPVTGGGSSAPSNHGDPLGELEASIATRSAQLVTGDPRQVVLAKLADRVKQIKADGDRTGSINLLDVLEVRLDMRVALASDRAGQYEQVRQRLQQVRAQSDATGSISPLDAMELQARIGLADVSPGTPGGEPIQQFLQQVAQARTKVDQDGAIDIVTAQQLSQSLAALRIPV